jgi:hypothetical protein
VPGIKPGEVVAPVSVYEEEGWIEVKVFGGSETFFLPIAIDDRVYFKDSAEVQAEARRASRRKY